MALLQEGCHWEQTFRIHSLTSLVETLSAFEGVVSQPAAPISTPPHPVESYPSRPCTIVKYLPQHTKSKMKRWAGVIDTSAVNSSCCSCSLPPTPAPEDLASYSDPTGTRSAYDTHAYMLKNIHVLFENGI